MITNKAILSEMITNKAILSEMITNKAILSKMITNKAILSEMIANKTILNESISCKKWCEKSWRSHKLNISEKSQQEKGPVLNLEKTPYYRQTPNPRPDFPRDFSPCHQAGSEIQMALDPAHRSPDPLFPQAHPHS